MYVGLVIYTVNTNGVLSVPFFGNNYYYKFYWGGAAPTPYDLLKINNEGVVSELIECVEPYAFPNSGAGATCNDACFQANNSPVVLFSLCNLNTQNLTSAIGCQLYTNIALAPLTGYNAAVINGISYDIDGGGTIIGVTTNQCC